MKEMLVIIPCAGAGSRFKKCNYEKPKPLIDVIDKPMIGWVIENMIIPDRKLTFVFIVQKEHNEQYGLNQYLTNTCNKFNVACNIIEIDTLTAGALCTCLKGRKIIEEFNDKEIFIINSDQYIEWNSTHFIQTIEDNNADACIITFASQNPKWSYVLVNGEGWINQVKEKQVISEFATIGAYYFKKSSDFIFCADEIINKGLMSNGEYYVAPVFNIGINQLCMKVLNYPIPTQCANGLGTPEDLKIFIEKMEKRKNRIIKDKK